MRLVWEWHIAPIIVKDHTWYIVIKIKIYWSNVLTERFSILYKNQTKEDTSF